MLDACDKMQAWLSDDADELLWLTPHHLAGFIIAKPCMAQLVWQLMSPSYDCLSEAGASCSDRCNRLRSMLAAPGGRSRRGAQPHRQGQSYHRHPTLLCSLCAGGRAPHSCNCSGVTVLHGTVLAIRRPRSRPTGLPQKPSAQCNHAPWPDGCQKAKMAGCHSSNVAAVCAQPSCAREAHTG